jgi:hypothetical protein
LGSYINEYCCYYSENLSSIQYMLCDLKGGAADIGCKGLIYPVQGVVWQSAAIISASGSSEVL